MAVSLVPSHQRWSFPAGNASLTQFQFVTLNGSGQLVTPSATGVFAFVLDDAPSLSGATITNDMPSGGYSVGTNYGVVLPLGNVQKVITGANLSAGVAIQTDTSGHAVPFVSGGVCLGWTLKASNSGDIVEVMLNIGH
jgi:hypothetical protein